jgi:uncharacterized protein
MKQEAPDERPKVSPLCRTVTKDGWDLEILIYEDGEGQWLLEVVNDADVSTCWTESFETDQAALNEALKTIEENSIEYFHERQPWREQ